MPPAEAPVTARSRAWSAAETVTVRGWGGGPEAAVQLVRPADGEEIAGAVAQVRVAGGGAIVRGLGRSYGDAAQLGGGMVIETSQLRRFELEPDSGTVTAQAGVTLMELLDAFVPQGWMVPVVPGTQHVTVGGAIASDIHGKNHGSVGTFGAHVEALGLLTAAGEVLELEPGDAAFAATLGGMGLTGVIVWARIRMRAVSSALLSVDTDRVDGLDGALAALSAPGGPHRVAWLDLLGSRRARGVVTRADHLDGAEVPASVAAEAARGGATVRARATVPAWWPGGALRASTVRAFNELRFRSFPRRRRGQLESIGAHMFPLDALVAWPRLYGPCGFVQYQLVVPFAGTRVLQTVIERLRAARVPCFLAVLKDFGPHNGAPLSFPIEGWTLALDLPRSAPGLEPLLDSFDALVAGAGGRVYLTKDARMQPDALRAMYPQLPAWQAERDRLDPERVWRSDLAGRTGLVG
jgi:decaprenylphospho-beta-D-ribofuranose 2-oxidase